MKIPKPGEDLKRFFASAVPKDHRVTQRLMFGNPAAFVNGNLFMGLFGKDLFLRIVDSKKRANLLSMKGASLFSPMKSHSMKEYVVVPNEWANDSSMLGEWIEISLELTGKLPSKLGRRKKAENTSRK